MLFTYKPAINLVPSNYGINFTHVCRHTHVLAHLMCAKLQKLVSACTVAYDFDVCMLVSEYTQHKRDAHYKLTLGLPQLQVQ